VIGVWSAYDCLVCIVVPLAAYSKEARKRVYPSLPSARDLIQEQSRSYVCDVHFLHEQKKPQLHQAGSS